MNRLTIILTAALLAAGCISLSDVGDVCVVIEPAGVVRVIDEDRGYLGKSVPLDELPRELAAAGAQSEDIVFVFYSSNQVDRATAEATLHALVEAGHFRLLTIQQ